jgi:hypothetical protein
MNPVVQMTAVLSWTSSPIFFALESFLSPAFQVQRAGADRAGGVGEALPRADAVVWAVWVRWLLLERWCHHSLQGSGSSSSQAGRCGAWAREMA